MTARRRIKRHIYYSCYCGKHAKTYNAYSVHKRYELWCNVCRDWAFKSTAFLGNGFSCPSESNYFFERYALAWSMEGESSDGQKN